VVIVIGVVIVVSCHVNVGGGVINAGVVVEWW